MQLPLHSPSILAAAGLLVCIALGYLLGEVIYHFAKCYALRRRGNQGTDLEAAGVLETATEREARLREGKRKLSLMPLVRYNKAGNTSLSRECAICLEDFEDDDVCRVVTGCNHAFHALCVDAWLKMQQRCPVCRGHI